MAPEAISVSHATPIILSRGAPLLGNCRLAMPAVKGGGAEDPLPEIIRIRVFQCCKGNYIITKHVYDECQTSLKGMHFVFRQCAIETHWYDTSDCHRRYGVTHHPRYTHYYLMLGTCSLITPDATGELISLSSKIHTTMFNLYYTTLSEANITNQSCFVEFTLVLIILILSHLKLMTYFIAEWCGSNFRTIICKIYTLLSEHFPWNCIQANVTGIR